MHYIADENFRRDGFHICKSELHEGRRWMPQEKFNKAGYVCRDCINKRTRITNQRLKERENYWLEGNCNRGWRNKKLS